MLGKEKVEAWSQPEWELVSQEEISPRSGNVPDHHVRETEAETW